MLGHSDRELWRVEHSAFHTAATFCGIWLLVGMVAVHTLAKMRTILEPLLWAFFLMMALLPLTDLIEWLLLQALAVLPLPRCCRRRCEARAEGIQLELELGESRRMQRSGSATELELGGALATDSHPLEATAEAEQAEHASVEPVTDSDSSGDGEARCCTGRGCGGCVRTVAVIIVMVLFIGLVASFFVMIYESAIHMQKNWQHYEAGARRITDMALEMKNHLPEPLVRSFTDQAVHNMEAGISYALSIILEHITSTVAELLMLCLYMIFWLCDPVHITESISAVFKRYILLKTLASALYALCIWILLFALKIDLAVVFGLISFFLNFVPEVGPFIAILLPAPVILFDGRQERPVVALGLALVGQLALKFFFGNIVEVKLVERQQDMRMHPVVILFFVAFFGWIWGATGMLLSVPAMAAAKAGLHAVPQTYRDPLLVLLEGDKGAPARYAARWEVLRQRYSARRRHSAEHARE